MTNLAPGGPDSLTRFLNRKREELEEKERRHKFTVMSQQAADAAIAANPNITDGVVARAMRDRGEGVWLVTEVRYERMDGMGTGNTKDLEDEMSAKKNQPSPKTFEGAVRLINRRFNEKSAGDGDVVLFTRQELRDVLVGLLEDVEGRQRSLSVGHVKTALMHLEKADDALVQVLLSGPAPERDPEVYELTGPFLRQVTGSVRHARSCVEEALDDQE